MPKKSDERRPQPECGSTEQSRNKIRCNHFALGKSCTARFFEGISAPVRCLHTLLVFIPTNGYTQSELTMKLYTKKMNFSIYGGNLPMAKNEGTNNYSYMTRRIGGTTYKVKVVFNDSEGETLEDKILRIIRNETVTSDGTCGIIESPQMSRQSERSAS